MMGREPGAPSGVGSLVFIDGAFSLNIPCGISSQYGSFRTREIDGTSGHRVELFEGVS